MELKLVAISKPEEVNLILGQAHFIKTVRISTRPSPGGAASPLRACLLRILGARA